MNTPKDDITVKDAIKIVGRGYEQNKKVQNWLKEISKQVESKLPHKLYMHVVKINIQAKHEPKDHLWLTMADSRTKKYERIQFQFGVNKKEIRFNGIWIDTTADKRVRERAGKSIENNKISFLRKLNDLNNDFYIESHNGDEKQYCKPANKLGNADIDKIIAYIRNRKYYLHIGRNIRNLNNISNYELVKEISHTFDRLWNIYEFLNGSRFDLSQSKKIANKHLEEISQLKKFKSTKPEKKEVNSEKYTRNPQHDKLLKKLANRITKLGLIPLTWRGEYATDLYAKGGKDEYIFEVKIVRKATPPAFYGAIGQLFFYNYYFRSGRKENIHLVLCVNKRIPNRTIKFLEDNMGITCLWIENGKYGIGNMAKKNPYLRDFAYISK